MQQAEGNNRPQFYFTADGFNVLGSSNTLSSLFLIGNLGVSDAAGITYQDVGVVGVTTVLNIDNMDISHFGSDEFFSDQFFGGAAILLSNVSNAADLVVNVTNSSLHDNRNGIFMESPDVNNTNTITVNMSHSAITDNQSGGGAIFQNDSMATLNLNFNNVNISNNVGDGLNAETNLSAGNAGTLSVNINGSRISNNENFLDEGGNVVVTNASIHDLTLNITNSVLDEGSGQHGSAGGGGLRLQLSNRGNINATVTGSSFQENDENGIILILENAASIATGTINFNMSHSIVGSNGAGGFALNLVGLGGTAGHIIATVNSSAAAPTLWSGDVQELLDAGSSSTLSATFNSTHPQIVISNSTPGATIVQTVYCDSSGACVEL